MAVSARRKPEFRVELGIASEDEFSDALSAFGHNVGPRIGPFRRSHAEIEDYCTRRILIAWHLTDRLAFPIVFKGTGRAAPDYLIAMGEAQKVLGLEVTAAGGEEWNRWLTEAAASEEGVHRFPRDGYVGDEPERVMAHDILSALERKAAGWHGKDVLKADSFELLIYENSEGGALADKSGAIEQLKVALRERGGVQPFARLHVISGSKVYLNVGANDERMVDLASHYDHDFVAWLDDQAAAARAGRAQSLDLPHIAEELRSMGASDRRALASHLRNLMLHLLRFRCQPRRRTRSWESSIGAARTEIETILDDSPSLVARRNLEALIAEHYPRARHMAALETGMDESAFPNDCPFTLEQLFDEDFPKGAGSATGQGSKR